MLAMSAASPKRFSGTASRILAASSGLLDELARHVGLDEARGDRVDRDAARGELAGEGLGEADHPGLRGRIVGLPGVAQ